MKARPCGFSPSRKANNYYNFGDLHYNTRKCYIAGLYFTQTFRFDIRSLEIFYHSIRAKLLKGNEAR